MIPLFSKVCSLPTNSLSTAFFIVGLSDTPRRRKLKAKKKRIQIDTDVRSRSKTMVESGIMPKPLVYNILQYYQPAWATHAEIRDRKPVVNYVPLEDKLRYAYFYNMGDKAPKEHIHFSNNGNRPSDRFVKRQMHYMRTKMMSEQDAAEKAFKVFSKERRDLEVANRIAKQQAQLLNIMPYRSTAKGGFYRDRDDYDGEFEKPHRKDPLQS